MATKINGQNTKMAGRFSTKLLHSIQALATTLSEFAPTLALDCGARATEPLPALLADCSGRAERLVRVGLCENAVSADTAAKPRGERLLVGEGAGQWFDSRLRAKNVGVIAWGIPITRIRIHL
jgi:hypothetical protein